MTQGLSASKDVLRLVNLAVAGLVPMFDPESQSFCYRRMMTPSGQLVNEGLSPRYTMMSLLGLARWESSGQQSPIDIRAAIGRLMSGVGSTRGVGDLGLLLWVCGEAAPDLGEAAWERLDLRSVLEQDPDARRGSTTELAWLLSGLSHLKLTWHGSTAELDDMAIEAYRRLSQNQGPYGIFGHLNRLASMPGMLRGHVGSFADQVYPIYGLTKFGQAFGREEAVEKARRCADAICHAQGANGQWWWHYDARTGKVFERYPVYSVHQHAMGPMALFALAEAAGSDYSHSIYRGLRWVTEGNEAGSNLVDEEKKLIWRGVYLPSPSKIGWTRLCGFIGKEDRTTPSHALPIRSECRPYELGWLVYAFTATASNSSHDSSFGERSHA